MYGLLLTILQNVRTKNIFNQCQRKNIYLTQKTLKKIKTLSIQTCANYPNKKHNPNIITDRHKTSLTNN
jgi:hypothetical protein